MENMNLYDPDYNLLYDMRFIESSDYYNVDNYSQRVTVNSFGIYFNNAVFKPILKCSS